MIQFVLFKIVKYWKCVGASNHKNSSQIVHVDIVISSMCCNMIDEMKVRIGYGGNVTAM